MFNKTRIILIIVSLLALLVILSMLFIKPQEKPNTNEPLPINQRESDTTATPNPSPKISFDLEKRDLLVERMTNKLPLSSADQQTKARLISSLNSSSGYLERTDDYQIEYIKSADLFQVEILSSNYMMAKIQSQSWLSSQGFSQTGLCSLPVMFYLSATVKEQLQDKDITFNYLAEGC